MVSISDFGAVDSGSFVGYTSIVPIYEGAETFVFRAKMVDSGAAVILKQTKNDYPSARENARLRREFMILRELALENTPTALALEEQERGVRLVMADIGYPTLREVLDGKKLDIETALVLAIEIANTLGAIHQRKVIHKDLTPKNVLVDVSDTSSLKVFVIDFGISARLSREQSARAGGRTLEGTPLYVSPEQTGRMNRAVDSRSDLYSLGVILYEMLVGHVPFQDQEVESVIQSHLIRNPISPSEISPSIPTPLSDIVLKLLAKTPEERYQSDAGLVFDLSECLRQWRASGSITDFELCTKDRAPELRRAQRLYGREHDVAALVSAFERARIRGPEFVLVAGYSGIGKSALVREMQKTIAQHKAHFISGKFEQLSRDLPLAPFFHAFRELTREILTESPAVVARWKAKLLTALKGNGALLTDLVPELVLIVGELPKVPSLPPDQAKNRFELTLLDFLHAFASEAHPLVLFLDDLQWMDPASRRLLQILLTDAFSRHVLILGAYRDNEIEPGHPLLAMLAELAKAHCYATEIQLGPLDREMVQHLVADTLTAEPAEVRDLADLVYEKTQGNPFFAHQFLVTLNERDLLKFDPIIGAWSWEVESIRRANVTDNVVDLLVEGMKGLPEATQHVLLLAACIGHSFDYGTLVIIAEKPAHEVAAALWDAMKAGPIVALDGDYRYLEGGPGADPNAAPHFDVRYQFVHDRVHQAAYLLLPEERRQKLHLTIGRLLRRHAHGEPRDEQLLDLVHHLNIGAPGIEDHAERIDLATLDLRAARRAKASTAYHAALAYSRAAIDLLCEDDWSEHYDLSYGLHLLAGKCAYSTGDLDESEVIFADLTRRAKTDIERIEIQRERVYGRISQGEFHEAIRVGLEALTLLGHPLPLAEMSPQLMGAEIAHIKTNLRGRKIEELIDSPEIKDSTILDVLRILDAIADVAHHLGPIVFSIINLRAVNIALVHGNADVAALPYACAGYMLAAIRGNVVEGLAFCRLAEAINAKFPNAAQAARIAFVAATSAHMDSSIRQSARMFDAGRDRCIETGEFHLRGVGSFLGTIAGVFAGDQIEDLVGHGDHNLAIVRRTNIPRNNAAMSTARQAIYCLAGKTRSATSFSDDTFDEDSFVFELKNGQPTSTNVHYGVLKAFVLLVHNQYAEAWEALEIATRAEVFGGGTLPRKIMPFLRSLLFHLLPPASETEEGEQLRVKYSGEMVELARFSPSAFGHFKALVDAEAARAEGDIGRAMGLYERAITLSQENKAPHIEALAYELFAKLFIKSGAHALGATYIKNAHRCYRHWGATAKIALLESEAAEVGISLRDAAPTRSMTTSKSISEIGMTLLGQTNIGSLRDAALVVRAAQEIASEIDLSKIVNTLAKLVLGNAGADRGALILGRDGQFVVIARLGEENNTIDAGGGVLLDDADHCAKSLIRFVARTQETVVIDDTDATTRFADDPYIVCERPRSILCLPLLHQGQLSGVLYLENHSTTGVFNEARVELLALLSSQAAIAIDTARLIETSRAASEDVKRANERLELEVARRTDELRFLNADLTSANARLEAELAMRREMEAEREVMQEQMFVAQRERLAELSTPLLPIARDIVVMPLIGMMNAERADQVLAVALDGAMRQEARVVILDVTGMKGVDERVAQMLVNVASAMRLLGAETLITGIGPRTAQTLISLGVDLTSFVTMSTLRSGMEYALKRVRNVRTR